MADALNPAGGPMIPGHPRFSSDPLNPRGPTR